MTLFSRFVSDMKLMLQRPPRQQYAALCYRLDTQSGAPEILLITSRDTGRWVIPKGWPMKGKAAHEVAAQEAFEEAGVRGKMRSETIGIYSYPKKLKDGVVVACQAHVYPLEFQNFAEKFKEQGVRKVEWMSCADAAKKVKEPQLSKLILAFEQQQLRHCPGKTEKHL